MIGKNTTLELQSYTTSDDGMGGSTTSWSKDRDVSGVFDQGGGLEEVVQGQSVERYDHRFYCEPDSFTEQGYRFVDSDNNVLDIVRINKGAKTGVVWDVRLKRTGETA